MAKTKFYKVNTLPTSQTQSGFGKFNRLTRSKRRKQLVASVFAVYILVGGLVGWVLFNNNRNSAQASESALISASLKLGESLEYKLGDDIKIGLTLQNTSVSESINNVSINLFSTKETIKWKTVTSSNITSRKVNISPEGQILMPLLSSGERVEYEIVGSIQNNQLEYTNIQAKLKYLNKDGLQEAETNRIRLNTQVTPEKSLMTLQSDKPNYTVNEEVVLNLESIADLSENGKVYISNRQTEEVANFVECEFNDAVNCQRNIKNLPAGDYSAMFISNSGNNFSNISWFSVKGKASNFTPGNQTSLELPTGSGSINGMLSVVAKKVISLNQTPNPETVCSFEVYYGKENIKTVTAAVQNDRSCKINLNSESFTKGDGLYTVKLANSNLEKEVSFINKTANLIDLKVESSILEKGKNVDIKATGILDAEAQPLNNKRVTLGILHTASGEYNEITNINSESLRVVDGAFSASLTPNLLNKAGYYMVYMKVEDGQQSDWVSLDFEDKQIALSGTGVLFDSNSLKIGQNVNFTLENLMDRNGNQVEEGDCSANIYSVSSTAPTTINGQIKAGICTATLPAGKIKTSGPALITFNSAEFTNKINQSKQINFNPGTPSKFGLMSFESPAKENFANNLIIGPVTDLYGNLASVYNYNLIIENNGQEPVSIPVEIQDGFAKVQIPSSYLNGETIVTKLENEKSEIVLDKSFLIDATNSKYVYANLPGEVSNDKNIQASVKGLELTNQTECKLSVIKSQDKTSETTTVYDSTTGECVFDWDLNENRSAQQALLQLTVGDQVFSNIISFKSSQPTNLFVVTPQIRITPKNELAISLLTSPIVDKQGKAVENVDLKWQYNGRVAQTNVRNGFAELELSANKLENKDIQINTTSRNLELDLDVKAGITSISKTNNLNMYIGNYDISNSSSNFTPILTSSLVTETKDRIFEFKSDVCGGKLLNTNLPVLSLKTHIQAGSCYVLAEARPGKNTINFESAGFTVGTFSFETTLEQQDVNWCITTSTSDKCMIQVLAPLNSGVEVIVKDGDKEYKFNSQELENTVVVSQNGLNPLKKYPVEVRYKDSKNQTIVQTKEILGEFLIK